MASNRVKHVVVDSGGFIMNAPINNIGSKIYSLKEVIEEIRDKSTRQRLQVLPYDIVFRQPSPEAIKIVTEFSKKTGDYKSLSAVDMKVMALTYQLEKENVGTDHIKSIPDRKVNLVSTNRGIEKNTEIAGFYLQKETRKEQENQDQVSPEINGTDTENVNEIEMDTDMLTPHNEKDVDSSRTDSRECIAEKDTSTNYQKIENSEVDICDHRHKEGDILSSNSIEAEDTPSDSDNEDESSNNDDGGWITPSNINKIKAKMGDNDQVASNVQVACLTTDFSIQNVLIQMGLNVVSIDGFLIKRAKNYVLRCHACMRITSKMEKEFCPHCGNKTLQRISMIVESDGQIKYFISKRRPTKIRGLKYSLPTPKGGKHANNPLLVEDQPMPQQRMSKKAQQRLDVFDPDYIAESSPFKINDVTSRAAQVGVKSGHYNKGRRNPNENKKVYGRRK